MSLKKKRKSPCPFASSKKPSKRKKLRIPAFNKNQSDVLAASDQGSYVEQEKLIALDKEEQSRWNNETIAASCRSKIKDKGKDKPAEPDSQESWQKLAGRTTVTSNHLQENPVKSVSCRFCHADVTLLENASANLGLVHGSFILDRVLSK